MWQLFVLHITIDGLFCALLYFVCHTSVIRVYLKTYAFNSDWEHLVPQQLRLDADINCPKQYEVYHICYILIPHILLVIRIYLTHDKSPLIFINILLYFVIYACRYALGTSKVATSRPSCVSNISVHNIASKDTIGDETLSPSLIFFAYCHLCRFFPLFSGVFYRLSDSMILSISCYHQRIIFLDLLE